MKKNFHTFEFILLGIDLIVISCDKIYTIFTYIEREIFLNEVITRETIKTLMS